MTHPTSRTALQQDFHQNFQNFHVFKRALFINYALIPRVVAWLGPLLYITGLVVLAPLAFGAGISIGTLFKLLVPQLSVLLTIPFTFEPTSILYWCVTIWELAVIYELIEKLVRETKIRTLFAQFQKNNRLLQTGYAYKINNHHSLIIT
ncbi:hypothetical protein [Pediococcus damnosus]|nr:hypothetical protein [Pediococcus damnosus]